MGRNRSESSRQAILKAAREALNTEGWEAISIESIARDAGVGKQTIYRWWSSKGSLVLEALREDAAQNIREEYTGDPRYNLQMFLTASFKRLTAAGGSGNAVRWLMAQAQLDPEFLVSFRDEFVQARRHALRRMIRAGGDPLPPHDEELLLDIVFGSMWYRLLVAHAELDDIFAERLTDLVWRERQRRAETEKTTKTETISIEGNKANDKDEANKEKEEKNHESSHTR